MQSILSRLVLSIAVAALSAVWVGSLGGVYSFCKYFTLESWISQPIHGGPPSLTTKLDFSLRF